MQELIRIWESKSFETKFPVFKRELAKDGKASNIANYVNTLRGAISPDEALFENKMIKKNW